MRPIRVPGAWAFSAGTGTVPVLLVLLRTALPVLACVLSGGNPASGDEVAVNKKGNGYSGIWYMNQPSGDEYVFKYSGGLGTYTANHRPLAIYCPQVRKTFFCYGGTVEGSHLEQTADDLQDVQRYERRRPGFLLHMVSYYDHETGTVPRPTILLDKETVDAHDNPVLAIDDKGYLWVFSTSHGTSRPSYIHRSTAPYSIDAFERVPASTQQDGEVMPITNFSYMQPWHVPGQGFIAFSTIYGNPVVRTIGFMTSPDGIHWSDWNRLGVMEKGHYQVSEVATGRAGTAFNYHPQQGVNWRTNLYYIETPDFGRTWRTASGTAIEVPLQDPKSPALVHDYEQDGRLVYLQDLVFDHEERPVILYLTSDSFRSGPQDRPRRWTTARWTGTNWEIREGPTSDSNYDTGSIFIAEDGSWRLIGPTEPGPQPFNPGGEMALWTSADRGTTWVKNRQLTSKSPRNHTFARRPLRAHADFQAFWADGHGRQPSESRLYFCDREGTVYLLPPTMTSDFEKPLVVD